MNKNIFNIVNEAIELEVGPDANGKTSLFSREDTVKSGVSHNKVAAPTIQRQWKKVDSRTRPELFQTGQEAFNKAKKLGVLDKISKEMDTDTADFEIDPITDELTINFDNGGSVSTGALSESKKFSNRRFKLREWHPNFPTKDDIIDTINGIKDSRDLRCEEKPEVIGFREIDLLYKDILVGYFSITDSGVALDISKKHDELYDLRHRIIQDISLKLEKALEKENFVIFKLQTKYDVWTIIQATKKAIRDVETMTESNSGKNTRLKEWFVVGENNDEMWFDQDAFSNFISDSLEINKEDVDGFNVCKEPWFNHDTCDYYTPVVSEEDLDNFVRDNLDTSMFGPDFEISGVKLDGETLTVEVLPGSGVEEDELDNLYIGPFHCVDFKHSKYADYLIFEPADDIVIDANSVER